jgi:hypothetical protein
LTANPVRQTVSEELVNETQLTDARLYISTETPFNGGDYLFEHLIQLWRYSLGNPDTE